MEHIRAFLRRKLYKESKSQSLFGTQKVVNEFGSFYDNNKTDLSIAGASILHAYVSKESFTPEELMAYKRAIADFSGVFRQASADMDSAAFGKVKKDTKNIKDML